MVVIVYACHHRPPTAAAAATTAAASKARTVPDGTPPLAAALFTGAPVGGGLPTATTGGAAVTTPYEFDSTPATAPLLPANTAVYAAAAAADGVTTLYATLMPASRARREVTSATAVTLTVVVGTPNVAATAAANLALKAGDWLRANVKAALVTVWDA